MRTRARLSKKVAFFLLSRYNIAVQKAVSRGKSAGRNEMYPFLEDLDEYFCAQYAKTIAVLSIPGYVVPPEGWRADRYSTEEPLPENMRLSHQPNKRDLLARFKASYVDKDFSCSFRALTAGERWENLRAKRTLRHALVEYLKRHGEDAHSFFEKIGLNGEIWKGILAGKYYPAKKTLFAIAAAAGMSISECRELLSLCGERFSSEEVSDVVMCYLLNYRIFNPVMMQAAFDEYGVKNILL